MVRHLPLLPVGENQYRQQSSDSSSRFTFQKIEPVSQKSRPEMVATIYGSSQAQLSERLGDVICA
ncbi:hypothetical protein GD428_04215 [Escherichia coli]|uniref:Uncharacterized protein n=1 Tax=Escherichia coli TaxID=562 RepID=A0A5N8HH03_ECOLX|nr:hypothetical protein [Escherichia coli]EFC9618924.1 hypothetical protein [Escherichia coli]EFI8212388.1 hypothetical protein [Escherichia coli]EFN5621704.1 hypothetical protein [Escherichia coli]EFO1159279.1 hypothetical protein [Escherichia coli]